VFLNAKNYSVLRLISDGRHSAGWTVFFGNTVTSHQFLQEPFGLAQTLLVDSSLFRPASKTHHLESRLQILYSVRRSVASTVFATMSFSAFACCLFVSATSGQLHRATRSMLALRQRKSPVPF